METKTSTTETKKVALYCRVSTNKQTNENQKVRLLQYATDKAYKFDLYEEVESSRKTRPVKQELLQKLRKGEYSHIIVYKLDRFARSSRELILEIQELIDKGVGFISISDNLDFSNSVGRLHFQILAAFAEFERNLISERTKEGIDRTRAQGKEVGRPKGRKDSKPRPKSGYYLREAKKRKNKDEKKGVFQSVETYIK
jgi:putative DNA-invertase from lambdoid prophage Rac